MESTHISVLFRQFSPKRAVVVIIMLLQLLFPTPDLFARQRFTHITINDGLSQSSIKAIQQDSHGYLWFGTADGLNRYDGFRIFRYHYNPATPHSIPSSDISCLFENPFDSVLWVGTQDAGPAIYNYGTDQFRSFTELAEGRISSYFGHIKDMVALSREELWIASTNRGIYRFNGADSTFYFPEFSSNPQFIGANSIESDNRGNMWIGTTHGLFVWSAESRSSGGEPVRVGLRGTGSGTAITRLVFDNRGNLYIGTTTRGLFRYHPDSKRETDLFTAPSKNPAVSGRITDLLVSREGDLWVSTPDGLYRQIQAEGPFIAIRNNTLDAESLTDDNVLTLYEEKSGIICIGTFMGGVNLLVPGRNRFPKYNNFLRSSVYDRGYNHVTNIFTDRNNSVWINTLQGLLEIKESYFTDAQSANNVVSHFTGTFTGSLMYAGDAGIFLSYRDGLNLMRPGGSLKNLTPTIMEQTGERITAFTTGMVDSDGTVWLSTSAGLLRYEPQAGVFRLVRLTRGNGERLTPQAMKIIEVSDGRLFIGTRDGILYSFDRHLGRIEQELPFDDGNEMINFTKIFALKESERGVIWIGTNCGLYRYYYNEGKIDRFLESDGLSNNLVYGILSDTKGKIWCTTNYGISVFDTQKGTFQNYTFQDGLQSNEFNQEGYYQSPEGVFYIGGIDGLNIFKPEEIESSSFIPPVHIEQMEIQYEPVTSLTHPEIMARLLSRGKMLKLSHNQSTFSFEYTALDYSQPERNRYRYILEPYDANWIDAGNRRIASYTSVPPGEYIFRVMGSNSDGVWNDVPASIFIEIKPPYWKTLWFRYLLFMTIGGMVYLLFYMRIRSIKRQKMLLEARVVEKTHTLVEKTSFIEKQNQELIKINNDILEKNMVLAEQHKKIIDQRDDLIKMTEQVQNSNQARIKFFTTISHEFRTPLTLIINPLKSIIDNIADADRDDILRKLKTVNINASKLLVLINQLLDIRKVEVTDMKLEISKIDIVSFTSQIVTLFNDLALQNEIRLEMKSSHPKIEIWADRLKIEKVLYNLLSNAFKYTRQGGSVTVRICRQQQGAAEEAFTLSVEDTGIGIDADKLPHLFDRFYQSDSYENKKHRGSGLGLAISKDYTELHDGSISVKSTPGKGSVFTVTLPVDRHRVDSEEASSESEISRYDADVFEVSLGSYIPVNLKSHDPIESRNKRRLVVIEDDETLNAYLKDVLSAEFSVVAATRGAEGLEKILSDAPDLIICDVMLPDMDGFEFCRKVRSDKRISYLPIILLTSLSDHENKLEGLKAGADYYIKKPFDLEELIIRINNCVDSRQRLRLKYTHESMQNSWDDTPEMEDKSFLDKAIECVEANITDTGFNVDELCSGLGISHSQVYRKIKSSSGLSISEFIRSVRLRKAARLLVSSQYKINEVAYMVGFSDPNYFTKCFTNLYGQTPREYVKSFVK
jgi:signal transduction histidine kinase/ligand-binding sensor domain-containing protein/CheY-like chemotaxis protein/AraC-like DNA-binding protein